MTLRILAGIFASILLAGCTNRPLKNTTDERTVKINLSGNYVTEDYFHRGEGYDWVAVMVNELNDSLLKISVRSRADKKKPTCTFDAMAVKQDSSGKYLAVVEGNSVIFVFAADSVLVKDDPGSAYSNLNYFCSGGGTIAGMYKKINGPLDSTQVDKVIFRKTLNYNDYHFFIEVYGKTLTIEPVGLIAENSIVSQELDGTVVDAETGDLNRDGFPEVLVFVQSVGSGSYGSVIGYSVSKDKSMRRLVLPEITENKGASVGYMGHDEFAIVENTLVRRFPVYKAGDSNANPTGGMRQIQYKLPAGENNLRFIVDKIVEY